MTTHDDDSAQESADALRRRRRIAVATGAGLVSLLFFGGAAFAVAYSGGHMNHVVSASHRSSRGESVTSSTGTATTMTTSPTPSTNAPDSTVGKAGSHRLQGDASTSPASPWQVSATSGLANLAPVTITATGIASGSYDVGQCPAGQTPSYTACVLNHVVTVTDGTMTSTVRVFWWLQDGRIDCGSSPGACVVGVLDARTTATLASFPIAFDPARRPTITVTPDRALDDGQSVAVRGIDIGEGTVQVAECLLPLWASCTAVEVQSHPDGTFGAALTVSRRLQWGGHGAGSGTCDIDGTCVVEVWLTPKGLDSYRMLINMDQPVALNFAPAPPSPSTTSASSSTTPATLDG